MTSRTWTAVAVFSLLPLAACNKDENESKILPIHADFAVSPIASDPVVYLERNPSDTSTTDDVALVDVMLRDGAAQAFNHINLEIHFDPGIVQIGEVDDTLTPLGDCRGTSACAPLCLNNVQDANTTGELVIGVDSKPGCQGHPGGSVRLLTLGFIAASVGTSPIELVDGAGDGDCEILSESGGILTDLNIRCDSDNARVIASR